MGRSSSSKGCGPLPFAETDNAFYERHLVFDNVVGLAPAGPRERVLIAIDGKLSDPRDPNRGALRRP